MITAAIPTGYMLFQGVCFPIDISNNDVAREARVAITASLPDTLLTASIVVVPASSFVRIYANVYGTSEHFVFSDLASALTTTVTLGGEWAINNVPLNPSGNTVIAAKQKDVSLNISEISNKQTTTMDVMPPTASIALSPSYEFGYKQGTVITVNLTASMLLQEVPTLTFTPNGQSAVSIPLAANPTGSQTCFRGSITIDSEYADGTSVFAFSGKNLGGVTGTIISSGDSFVIDKTAPTLTLNLGETPTTTATRQFTGDVSDDTSGIYKVKLAHNENAAIDCEFGSGTWHSSEIALVTGSNNILVKAYDKSGDYVNLTSNSTEQSGVVVQNSTFVTNGLALHLDAGNVASYPGTGSTIYDLSGNNRNGTLYGGTTYNALGGGSFFTRGYSYGDYIEANLSTANLATNYSGDCWVYATSANTSTYGTGNQIGVIWNANPSGPYYGRGLYLNKASAPFKVDIGYPSTYEFGASSINADAWYHYALTHNSSTNISSVYINGVLLGTHSNVNPNASTMWRFMYSNYGYYYSLLGYFANVRVYENKILSQEEVTQNFNAFKGRYGL